MPTFLNKSLFNNSCYQKSKVYGFGQEISYELIRISESFILTSKAFGSNTSKIDQVVFNRIKCKHSSKLDDSCTSALILLLQPIRDKHSDIQKSTRDAFFKHTTNISYFLLFSFS